MSFKFPLRRLVLMEVAFLERYGYAIPRELTRESVEKQGDDETGLMRLYRGLCQLPEPESPFFSASDFASVTSACPGMETSLIVMPSKKRISDGIRGGWLGRAAGCVLGKPLECGLTLPEIKAYLGDEFPVKNYLRLATARRIARDKNPKLDPEITKSCSREHVAYAVEDDDLNYTALNLLLLERKGFNFSRADIGETWAAYLPAGSTYGAETTALVNYLYGLPVAAVPVHLNPFRDEIGAQIRADMFGYVCPGRPGRAAGLAFRDASFSHVADGIYGAMFTAAMISSAYSADTITEIITTGLAFIPGKSRAAELVRKTLEWSNASGGDWEAVYGRIKASTPQYRSGHTVNNAAYVVNALLASGGDYGKGVAAAVMQGHDTDCNGATVGSILGVRLGEKRLPVKWTGRLNDRLKTGLRGMSDVAISELAERTTRLAI